MYYLIFKDKIVDKAERPFPVSAEMEWLESVEDYTPGLHVRQNGQIIDPTPPPRDPTTEDKRRSEYPPIAEQLDMLYHAMEIGEISKATEWFNTIKAVKDKYPKEDVVVKEEQR